MIGWGYEPVNEVRIVSVIYADCEHVNVNYTYVNASIIVSGYECADGVRNVNV